MSTNGKGSKARPLSVSRKELDEAWERTFGTTSTGASGVTFTIKPGFGHRLNTARWIPVQDPETWSESL